MHKDFHVKDYFNEYLTVKLEATSWRDEKVTFLSHRLDVGILSIQRGKVDVARMRRKGLTRQGVNTAAQFLRTIV